MFYQALHFKNMIEDFLKSEDVSDSQKEILVELNSEISEYDNPIIISGKWKCFGCCSMDGLQLHKQ